MAIKFKITDGAEKPEGLSENNLDCAPRALANASGIGYPAAYILFEQSGRLPGKCGQIPLGLDEYVAEGFGTFVSIRPEIEPTVAQFITAHPTGRYIVRTPSDNPRFSHAIAVVDGVVLDNQDPRPRRRVKHFWIIQPKEVFS